MNTIKPIRFLWRVSRNLLCVTDSGRRLLFPNDLLASRFGRSDAEYAWGVFSHHLSQLTAAGFRSADRLMEVGPGRNLGTALLWWCFLTSDNENKPVKIVCWDVFENAKPNIAGFWPALAKTLLASPAQSLEGGDMSAIRERLLEVAEGRVFPKIAYRVEPLIELEKEMRSEGHTIGLVYSHAAIEHIWHIDEFWNVMGRLTSQDAWHSHRIDLADHGRRESNYIEMLEWSRLGYWLTMRFVPGAINRWRACRHLAKISDIGFKILFQQRSQSYCLPVPLHQLSPEFRQLGEIELRTTALDIVAIKE